MNTFILYNNIALADISDPSSVKIEITADWCDGNFTISDVKSFGRRTISDHIDTLVLTNDQKAKILAATSPSKISSIGLIIEAATLANLNLNLYTNNNSIFGYTPNASGVYELFTEV